MAKFNIPKRLLIALCVSASSALHACGDCVSVGLYGIAVTVIDDATQKAPTSVPSLRVTDGAYLEVVPAPSFNNTVLPMLRAATEREGVYDVLVRAGGVRISLLTECALRAIRTVVTSSKLSTSLHQ